MASDETKGLTGDTDFSQLSADEKLNLIYADLTALKTQINERLQDTRPIWERTLAEILEVKSEVRSLNRQFTVLNKSLTEAKGDILDHEDPLSALENKPA